MTDLFSKDTPAAPSKKEGPKTYTAEDIEVLEGLEPVRRRPGMYIGGTDERALHHLVTEVLDNSMDEAVAGHATRIELELHVVDRRAGRAGNARSHIELRTVTRIESSRSACI